MPDPHNYRVQDACPTCRHVFELIEYDCGEKYFCTLGAPPRPPCGSCYMNEDPDLGDEIEGYDTWEEWSKDRERDPAGICDEYKKR